MIYLKSFQNHTEYEDYMSQTDLIPNVSYCINQNEVHYNPYVDPFNGHDYVDLGLPSGLKWAKCNVGANSETDYGLYFSWGGTTGYPDASSGKSFSWADYELGNGQSQQSASNMTKYNSTDGKTVLESVDDAATVNMGGSWRMPTREEFNELFNTTYVNSTWVYDYNDSGVEGILFTSVSNGNTLFVPASGYYEDGALSSRDNVSLVWSSSLNSSNPVLSTYLYADDGDFFEVTSASGLRYRGYSVRGVISL